MSGYVLTHRDVYGHPAFRDLIEASVFIWMFARASWQPVRLRYKNRIVDLKRGEFAMSVRDLADHWNWTKARAESFLDRLREQDMVRTSAQTGVNIITICNYDKYQLSADGERTPEKTVTGQRPDSDRTQNKEGNKDNERLDTDVSSGRAFALPASFPLTEPYLAKARKKGFDDEAGRRLFAEWVGYWSRERGDTRRTEAGWLRCWENNLTRKAKTIVARGQSAGAGQLQHGSSGSGAQGMVAAIRDVAARLQPQPERDGAGELSGIWPPEGRSAGDFRGSHVAGEPFGYRAGADGNDAVAHQGEGRRPGDRADAGGAVHGTLVAISGGRGY